ncbi:MAG: thiamine pyrophosphate-dependent enzyme [Planctomycetota bacterium]
MPPDRVTVVEQNLENYLATARPAAHLLASHEPVRPGSSLTAAQARALFEDQVLSRQLDMAARRLKARGVGYYTIASAGHEQNAVLGTQLRVTDPALLHYRSGGFMMARSRHLGSVTPTFDTLLSLCASRDDPIAQGRHKVWGSRPLGVPPQTSTIASHLPKAVGMAFALGRARRLGIDHDHPHDALVCCSFGDASANHATALAGINAARYAHRRGNPVPVLFVCEDNGIGISVRTPRRWINDAFSGLRHLRYFEADGELDEIWETTRLAIETCRATKGPVFLHLRTVRLWGHAGSDVETTYRELPEIEAVEDQDPLLRNARFLIERGAATPGAIATLLRTTRTRVEACEPEAAGRGHLASREGVMIPLSFDLDPDCRSKASEPIEVDARAELWRGRLPEAATAPTKRTLGAHINAALADEMLRRPEIVVFGEDVGRKGGVYYVTAGLQERFGQARVFDTLLDETTILGVAQGAAQAGLLPIPEIQYLAYLHNAIDQLRGEASSLSFFSVGQFTNPMVVRIASFAYQRGFGGHFHNDNAIAALREIPGMVVATPSRGEDAVRMLRGCLTMAKEHGRVIAFLEPIALYHEKDLHEPGDQGWLSDYPAQGEALLPGEAGVHGEGKLLFISYANGVRMCRRVARRAGLDARVLDLRWLNPLPWEAIEREASTAAAIVVVDECRASGGVADAILARLAERGYDGKLRSVRSADTFIPLGPTAPMVLVSEEEIEAAAREVTA